jgi:KDO2-lipid IV(A) lauroyltransferase
MMARLALAFLWLMHWLPARAQAAVGRAVGSLLHALAADRRRIATRNIELCLPELDARARVRLVREHFRWLGCSILERGLLWHAPRERLERLITVEGDLGFAERCDTPVMWLVPHFMALEVVGLALQLFQGRGVAVIYQPQSNPIFDAAMRKGRQRFGGLELFARSDSAKPLIRAIRQQGMGFGNLPDMDFGIRDAAFVPFFGVPAATLLAPSRMARMLGMTVQPVVAEMLAGGGWRVRFLPPLTNWPTDDALADTLRLNQWIEAEVRRNPAQYLWVHRRFKTRPVGEAPLY